MRIPSVKGNIMNTFHRLSDVIATDLHYQKGVRHA
jgi:hypothetical protein